MDVRERLHELAKITGAATPVVSVYLNTCWADEHQRERVRVFLKDAIHRARGEASSRELREDLDWIERQGARLIDQVEFPDAQGVALFACHALGLREVVPVRAPFGDAFLVADRPLLTPLAEVAEEAPPALVVFVDGVSARLIPLNLDGRGEELTLRHQVEGRHRRGGWALMAQSRYQRHIEAQRGRHFEAVAAALTRMVEERGIEHIVLAGETRAVAVFGQHLPPLLAARVVGSVPAARYESASVVVERAADLLAALDQRQEAAAVESALTEAAKGGRAVAGLDGTLEAVGRGAVHNLYLLKGFDRRGRACVACAALQNGEAGACRVCGAPTRETELGEAIVDRVIAAGGVVEVVEAHRGLAHVGGIAARLRYATTRGDV